MKEAAYWTWFIIAALVILVFGGLHIIVMHVPVFGFYNPAGGSVTAWENVAFRSQHPFVVFTYVILLAAALYHGLYGLRTIVFELGLSKSFQETLTVLLWILGVILFCVGTYAAIAGMALSQAS